MTATLEGCVAELAAVNLLPETGRNQRQYKNTDRRPSIDLQVKVFTPKKKCCG
jgi:hypothetical protein